MDAPVPDTPIPDAPVADVPIADVPIADVPIPDATIADAPVPDVPVPDTLQPDTLQPDTLQPDTLQPDTLQPDTLQPDLVPPPSCTDNLHNGSETDVDCGGSTGWKVVSGNFTPNYFCGYTPGPTSWSAINGYGPNWTYSVGQYKTYGSWPLVCTHNTGYHCNHIQFYVR